MSKVTDEQFEKFYREFCRPYFKVDPQYLNEDLLKEHIRYGLNHLIGFGKIRWAEIIKEQKEENPNYDASMCLHLLHTDDVFRLSMPELVGKCAGGLYKEYSIIAHPSLTMSEWAQVDAIISLVCEIIGSSEK